MNDFFKRNLTRPTQEKELPQYLKPFEYEKEDDVEELYKHFKSGLYDIVKEERQLNNLRRSLG